MPSKKQKKRRRWLFVLIALSAFLLGVVLYMRSKVVPIIQSVSEEKVRALTVSAVNEAVLAVMSDYAGVDFLSVTYASDGSIQLIQLKSAAVNAVAQQTTLLTQTKLTALGNSGIDIPFGTLTGMVVFTGKGPPVSIQVMPVGSVTSHFSSTFTSAGINQTIHRLYLKLNADISVIFPGANNRISTLTEVMIDECIIIGDIPDTYLNSDRVDHMLDLIP